MIEAATGLKAELKFPPATSLVEAGREIDRAGLLVELLERLERRYDAWANVSPG